MKTTLNPSLAASAYALTQKMSSNPAAALGRPGEAGNSFADVLEATVGRVRESGQKADAMAMTTASVVRPTWWKW